MKLKITTDKITLTPDLRREIWCHNHVESCRVPGVFEFEET